MLSFLAMLFTFRLGLGAAPVDGAVASLRNESLAVAVQHAADAQPVTTRRAGEVLGGVDAPARRALSHRDWERLLTDAIQNESIANAAMWLASQPLHVSVTGEKFFVSGRIATP
jgi:enoyl-[acyl-carrier-protein] reductase (NADH)